MRAHLIGLAFLCVTPTLVAQSARDQAIEVKAVDFAFTAPDTLLTRDRPGDRLLVFCQLREAPEKPKHDEMGMFKVIYIK